MWKLSSLWITAGCLLVASHLPGAIGKKEQLRYGPINPYQESWPMQQAWLWRLPLPSGYEHLLGPDGRQVKELWLNKDIAGPMQVALIQIREAGLAERLTHYGGCFNIRKIRGREDWSMHSYGIACDFNHLRGGISEEVAVYFERVGFTWGGRWVNRDAMHVEMRR